MTTMSKRSMKRLTGVLIVRPGAGMEHCHTGVAPADYSIDSASHEIAKLSADLPEPCDPATGLRIASKVATFKSDAFALGRTLRLFVASPPIEAF